MDRGGWTVDALETAVETIGISCETVRTLAPRPATLDEGQLRKRLASLPGRYAYEGGAALDTEEQGIPFVDTAEVLAATRPGDQFMLSASWLNAAEIGTGIVLRGWLPTKRRDGWIDIEIEVPGSNPAASYLAFRAARSGDVIVERVAGGRLIASLSALSRLSGNEAATFLAAAA